MNLILLVLAQAAVVSASPHQQAIEQYRKHAFAEAAASFKKALETEKSGTPDYNESVLLLGQSLLFTNHANEAIPYLEKAQASNEVLYMLGSAYLQSHALSRCEATFAALYGVDAKSAPAHLITAQMMLRLGFEDEAASELLSALKMDAKLPEVHYLLGELAMFRGQPEEAVRYLRDELALNPNSSNSYYKLGDAYTRKSEWSAAITSLQKSVWLNPNFSGPYILLGKAYLKTDKLADAEGVLRHAIQLDPNNYSAHYLLGQTLVQAGRAEEGRQMLEQSQKLKQ